MILIDLSYYGLQQGAFSTLYTTPLVHKSETHQVLYGVTQLFSKDCFKLGVSNYHSFSDWIYYSIIMINDLHRRDKGTLYGTFYTRGAVLTLILFVRDGITIG